MGFRFRFPYHSEQRTPPNPVGSPKGAFASGQYAPRSSIHNPLASSRVVSEMRCYGCLTTDLLPIRAGRLEPHVPFMNTCVKGIKENF